MITVSEQLERLPAAVRPMVEAAIQAFVQRAVEVTQPWYDDQRQAVERFEADANRKAWWKLW